MFSLSPDLPPVMCLMTRYFGGRHGWKGDACLEVTLLNTEDGFKHELYGDSITIQRTIRAPSGGSFALIGADGKVRILNFAITPFL